MAALGAAVGLAQAPGEQDEPHGAFVDGEWVEFYEYVPEFIAPDVLEGHIEAKTPSILIVDTAAPLIFEEEHIPGAINFPWVHSISLPVGLPRDKTLVLYCACNDHEDSADMAMKLSQLGYLDVKVLEGGWFKWLDLEYPTEGTIVEEGQ